MSKKSELWEAGFTSGELAGRIAAAHTSSVVQIDILMLQEAATRPINALIVALSGRSVKQAQEALAVLPHEDIHPEEADAILDTALTQLWNKKAAAEGYMAQQEASNVVRH